MPRLKVRGAEVLGAALVLSLFVLSAYLSRQYMDSLRGLLEGNDAGGMILYVMLTVTAVVVAPVSTLPLIPVAAVLWGAPLTALLSLAGWLLGGAIAFGLARRFGRPLVGKLVDLQRLEQMEGLIPERNRFLAVVLLRIAIPFDILSYGLGLFSTMSLLSYMAASLLGAAPFAVIFSYAATMHIGVTVAGGVLAGVALVLGYRSTRAAAARHGRPGATAAGSSRRPSEAFEQLRKGLETECTRCGRCAEECRFLMTKGAPGHLAASMTDPDRATELAFQCSLCGYCEAVCTAGCSPARLFDAARIDAAANGRRPVENHKRLLAYERIGMSPLFNWGALPEGCTRVFFPGCAMPGNRPGTTLRAFRLLKKLDPSIGVVLDCCGEPSRMVGLHDQFTARMAVLAGYLSAGGVEEIVVACPACLNLFNEAEVPFHVTTIYELLADSELPSAPGAAPVSIHDSCLTRDAVELQGSVRTVLDRIGVPVTEVAHRGRTALCCGDCGGVKFIDSPLSDSWMNLRLAEVEEDVLVTYCAACQATLARRKHTVHLLDIVLDGGRGLREKPFIPFPPLTYLNRLLLKWRLKKEFGASLTYRVGRHYNDPVVM